MSFEALAGIKEVTFFSSTPLSGAGAGAATGSGFGIAPTSMAAVIEMAKRAREKIMFVV